MSGTREVKSPEATAEDDLAARLHRVIERECGSGSRIFNFGVAEDGHAGLTFRFEVAGPAGNHIGAYILKIAPVGVTRRGNTDVYRQAPLLHGLKAAGLPVPHVPWASPDEDQLGTPFIVMERLPGRVFVVWEPHASFSREPAVMRTLWLQAAQLLARLHKIDWRNALPDWEAPRPLREELDRWTPLLRHAQEEAWLTAGTELGQLLAAHMPDEQPIGIIHGDFQPGNILYVDGRAEGLIDWELTSIGAQGLDVGWLFMMSDPEAWDPRYQPFAPVSHADLLAAYRDAGGPALFNIDWYQALAHYRLGVIACLNVKLHRTGRRTDELWERLALSISRLFARGLVLAGRSAAKSSSST